MISVVSNAAFGEIDSVQSSNLAVEEKDLSIIGGFIGDQESFSISDTLNDKSNAET